LKKKRLYIVKNLEEINQSDYENDCDNQSQGDKRKKDDSTGKQVGKEAKSSVKKRDKENKENQ
jgi:hypothetical protein